MIVILSLITKNVKELHKLINDLINGKSLLSDEHLTIMINSTERELSIYDHILKLLI